MMSGPAPLPAQPLDVAPADRRIELLGHQRTKRADRGARAIVDEGRRRRLAHAQEPARPAGEIEHRARTEAQRKGHAIADVAIAARRHLIVDGENEPAIAGGCGARGEFGGKAAIPVEKNLHPFRPRRRGADLLDGRSRGVARAIDGAEPRRRAGGGEFGARPQEAGEPGRADDDWRRQLDAEKLDRLVALWRAGKHLGPKLDCRERRLVAPHGDLVAGCAVDHVEHHARQPLARQLTQRRDAVALALELRGVHQTESR